MLFVANTLKTELTSFKDCCLDPVVLFDDLKTRSTCKDHVRPSGRASVVSHHIIDRKLRGAATAGLWVFAPKLNVSVLLLISCKTLCNIQALKKKCLKFGTAEDLKVQL